MKYRTQTNPIVIRNLNTYFGAVGEIGLSYSPFNCGFEVGLHKFRNS